MTLTVFAALAVVVALLGVYAVMAYGVSTGARDIGVRIALGARASSVRAAVLRRALAVVLVGGAVGAAAASALGPVLRSMLYEVSERDPATLMAAMALAAVGSLGAAYAPARRASRVDPMRVLREE